MNKYDKVSVRTRMPIKKRKISVTVANSDRGVTLDNDKPKNIKMKNLAMSGIFFSNLYVYTVVRDLKDVIFITECGASYIPFVKTWINLPISICFMFIYNKLLDRFSFTKTYFIIYSFMTVLYTFVGLFLYPIRNSLLIDNVPIIFSKWISTLYYVLSPIWGTIVVSVLFWSFANQYTSVDEAKSVYPLMGMLANVALILGGLTMNATGNIFISNWELNVQVLTFLNLLMSVVSLYLYKYITKTETPLRSLSKKKKTNKNLLENFVELGKNQFVRNMVIMISCYGLLIGFYESIWKHYLKIFLQDPIVYSKFMGTVSSLTGVTTIFMMTFGSYWLKHMTWTKMALITPISMMGLGIMFFSCIHTNSIIIISYTGAILTIFLKGAKYALFDPCKEIAYIPMDQETKTRGKATIEILSAPIGKSGSNCILQILILLLGSLELSAHFIGILYLTTGVTWIISTISMGKTIDQSTPVI
tara:strand:+ start:8208 stop:9629 length:1422 start_codon:yes stop_codon:yes gene_type:complete